MELGAAWGSNITQPLIASWGCRMYSKFSEPLVWGVSRTAMWKLEYGLQPNQSFNIVVHYKFLLISPLIVAHYKSLMRWHHIRLACWLVRNEFGS